MSSVVGKSTRDKKITAPHKRARRAGRVKRAKASTTDDAAKTADRQFITVLRGDSRRLDLQRESVDLVVTSPPYWRKRDYKITGQIGQERNPDGYVEAMMDALREWRRALRPTGSVFLNVGDTYWNRSLADIPGRLMVAARGDGWLVRNRIVWVKNNGTPDPAKNRLTSRHEYIIHLTTGRRYYYDLFGYTERFGNGSNPGDVWTLTQKRKSGGHLAPFPDEIAERLLALACPPEVCVSCGSPRRRIVRRTRSLNLERPQARRALELAREHGLTPAHIAAIQATGISDAGKAQHFQTGAGRGSASVQKLAAEAKSALNGYFREFTFPLRKSAGWSGCGCRQGFMPGVVLDPFMGTGTTLKVAARMGRSAVGVDLSPQSLREFKSITASVFT